MERERIPGLNTYFDSIEYSRKTQFIRIDHVNESVSDDLLELFAPRRGELFLHEIEMRPDDQHRWVRSSGLEKSLKYIYAVFGSGTSNF